MNITPLKHTGFAKPTQSSQSKELANSMLTILDCAIKKQSNHRFETPPKEGMTNFLIHKPNGPITKLAITGINGSTTLTFTEFVPKGKTVKITKENSTPETWQKATGLLETLGINT